MHACPAVWQPNSASSAPSFPPKLRSFFSGSSRMSSATALPAPTRRSVMLADTVLQESLKRLNPAAVLQAIRTAMLTAHRSIWQFLPTEASFPWRHAAARHANTENKHADGRARDKSSSHAAALSPGRHDGLLVGLVQRAAHLGQQLVCRDARAAREACTGRPCCRSQHEMEVLCTVRGLMQSGYYISRFETSMHDSAGHQGSCDRHNSLSRRILEHRRCMEWVPALSRA